MPDTQNLADQMKRIGVQFRVIGEVADFLETVGSLEDATRIATEARKAALDALAAVQSDLEATRQTIASEKELALVASETASAELADCRESIQREQEASQRDLANLSETIKSRRGELDAVESQIAEARKRVADFMGGASVAAASVGGA